MKRPFKEYGYNSVYKKTQTKLARNLSVSTLPPSKDDKKSQLLSIFENELEKEIYAARLFDINQKQQDAEKAKSFRENFNKLNPKKNSSSLNLTSMRVGINTLGVLVHLIPKYKIHTLNLCDNGIAQYGMHIVKSILASTSIRHINLSSNMISDIGIQIILDQLLNNQHLISLDLGLHQNSIKKNSLGCQGAKLLAAVLFTNKVLQCLKLQDNDIGVLGSQVISKAIKENKKFKQLKLAQNQIKTRGAQLIMRSGYNLTHLDISKNYIKSSIGRALQLFLTDNTVLKHLNLEYNQLMVEGARSLAKGLAKSALVSLNVRGNGIRNEGIRLLCQALKNQQSLCNKTLQQFDFSLNQITQEGIQAFACVLPMTSLKVLKMSKNHFESQGLRMILREIQRQKRGTSLTKFQAESCMIGDEGLLYFLQFALFTSLKSINFSDNFISQRSQRIIVELINKNHSLIEFNLSGNRLSLSCLSRVKKITQRNIRAMQAVEPNKIKKQIERMRYQQRKINQTNQQLQQQNRQIIQLKEQKNRLQLQIVKLQRQEAKRRQEIQHKIYLKKQEIQRKRASNLQKIEELRRDKKNKEIQVTKLKEQVERLQLDAQAKPGQ